MKQELAFERSLRLALLTVLPLAMLLASTYGPPRWAVHAAEDSKPEDELFPSGFVDRVLNEEWERIAGVQQVFNRSTESPVLRFLMAHAYLAINRNNESLNLFASAANQEDLKQWDEWTKKLLYGDEGSKGHQDNAVAWYLRGDALARLKQWKDAEKAFDQALTKKPGWYLALNARGVIRHARGDIYGAEEDFEAAIKAKPDFADAYASLGTLNIRTYAPNQIAARFEQARQHSQDKDKFALPLNGIACDRYVWQKYEEAQAIFEQVPADSSLSALAHANAFAAFVGTFELAAEDAENAGMAIEAKILPGGGRVFTKQMPWELGDPIAEKIPPSLRVGVKRVIELPNGPIVTMNQDGTILVIHVGEPPGPPTPAHSDAPDSADDRGGRRSVAEMPGQSVGGSEPPDPPDKSGGAAEVAVPPVESLRPNPIPVPIADRLAFLTGQPILTFSATGAEQITDSVGMVVGRYQTGTATPPTIGVSNPPQIGEIKPPQIFDPPLSRILQPAADPTPQVTGVPPPGRPIVPNELISSLRPFQGENIQPSPRFARPMTFDARPPGGVAARTKDISRPRRGPWFVTSVYGLAYELPLDPKK